MGTVESATHIFPSHFAWCRTILLSIFKSLRICALSETIALLAIVQKHLSIDCIRNLEVTVPSCEVSDACRVRYPNINFCIVKCVNKQILQTTRCLVNNESLGTFFDQLDDLRFDRIHSIASISDAIQIHASLLASRFLARRRL